MKDFYIQLLKSVRRPGVDALVDYLEKSDFFEAPASTIYHGSYAGGLVEHSLNVYTMLQWYVANLQDSDFELPKISEESVIIVALLHDLCKVNCYHESTRNMKNEQTGKWEKVPCYKREPLLPMGHGGKSVFIIQQFIKLTPEEAQAIYWHMGAHDTGPYNTLNELGKSYEMNLLAFLLNQADMMATYIAENPNYKLRV